MIAEARDRFLEDSLNEPSDRRIIDIVKSTIAPNVVTDPSILKEYVSIHPAIHGYSVRGGSSGRAERRTKDRFEPLYHELPGQGPIGNPGECDRGHGSEACLDMKTGRMISLRIKRWYCDRPTCPECMEHWTNTSAAENMRKIKAGRQLFSFYGARYRLCHVVVSAPPDYARFIGVRKGYDLLLEDFYRVFDAFDMHGLMIFHPWRGKKDEESDVDLVVHDEGMDEDGHFWELGPHAHAVTFCDPVRIRESSAEFYESTGFVIKVIAEDMDERYAENVLSYALSHTGVIKWEGHKDLKTIHPFGMLATSKKCGISKLATIKEDVPLTCSECGGYLYDTKELDMRIPEEDLLPQSVPLYHDIYVRRDELQGHKIMTDGLSDRELLEYARARICNVAIIYDDRPTVIQANCDVDKLNEKELRRPLYWSRPAYRGQTKIVLDNSSRRRLR